MVMRFKTFLPLAAIALTALSAPANAVIAISVDSGNLAAFSYTVNSITRTIDIYETWGPSTAGAVILRFDNWNYGIGSWIVNKHLINETGQDWTSFSHELLQSRKTQSPDNDGLSFAQLGIPTRPRTSDKFASVMADELDYRDYLLFHNGIVTSGQPVFFTFGLTARRNTPDTNPFYLRQSEFLAGVPEPATWAMLIAGFGMVGFAARRRRPALGSVTA
jgi:hypothetical protein